MVYCGKPSKACRQCRRRNIKCDKKRESCGQCIRAQLTCPGYHDPTQLTFRDETKSVMKKVLPQKSSSIPSFMLQPPVEERAKRMFVNSQVFDRSGTLQYMKNFYPPKPSEDDHLSATVRAVYLAYFSKEMGSSHSVLVEARKQYSSALTLTKTALHNPKLLSRNSTVLTIILLNLFENLTRHQNPIDAETKHLEGALALVKLRGYQQFQDRMSVILFVHLGSYIVSSCLERGVEVPVDFINLRRQVEEYVDVSEPSWQLSDLMVRAAKFRSAAIQGMLSEDEINSTCQRLGTELDAISKAAGPTVSYYDRSEADLVQIDVWFRNGVHQLRALLEDSSWHTAQASQVDGRSISDSASCKSDRSTPTLSSSTIDDH